VTLLCIHGAGCTPAIFHAQREAFPDLHAPQLPHCDSVPAFADFIAAYVAHEELKNVVLCGHSLGAMVAIESALRAPSWLRGIAVLGGGAHLAVAPAIFDMLRNEFESAAGRIAGYMFADRNDPRIVEIAQSIRTTGREATVAAFRACDAYDATERVSRIRLPLLALTGERDRLTPPDLARALAGRVPGAEARIVAGAGHMVMLETPADTNGTLRSFVSKLDRKSISL